MFRSGWDYLWVRLPVTIRFWEGARGQGQITGRGTMAILLVEQYYDFAEELADDYLAMQRGEFIARGPGTEMQAHGVRQMVAI